ncbi:MAG: hypothetical protein U1F40_12250 [Turneriella sp.]
MVRLRSPQVRILTRIRSSIFAIAMLPLLAACLGRATPPDQVKLTQAQNEVLGKFARQVGERELNILLKDPNDTTLPGIPVGDLLYILSKVNEDKLIRLVKGITATTTLELILTIKRVACTRYEAIFPGNGFDATDITTLNQCTWQHFHLPNVMVQLLNGANDQGLQTLIDTVNHSYPTLACASSGGNLAANQPLCPATTMVTTQPGTTAAADTFNSQPYKVTVDHYSFLMKLAYIVVGFDTPSASDPNLASTTLVGPTKLYNLMNLTLDGRDMAYLLDSFDSNTVNLSRETPATPCPGAGTFTSNCVYIDTTVPTAPVYNTYDAAGNLWRDICPTLLANNACDPAFLGYQLQGLRNLLSVMDSVTDTSKMGTLLNGRRTTRNDTAQDTGQIRYFTDRLRPVIEHRAPAACVFPGTAAEQTMQDFRAPHGGSGAWNTKLAEIINRVNNVDRMMDLIYGIDDGFDLVHTSVFTCPGRGIDNLMVLLNNINNVDPHINDLTGYNPPYTNLTANTQNSELITVAYLIDNVILDPLNASPAKRNKVKYLIQYLGDTRAVLQLACYTAVADNNPVGVATCANRGLINQVADGSKLDDTSAVDLTAAGQKLVNLMGTCLPGLCATDGVQDIEDMRFLIRNVSMANLSGMLKGLLISSTQRTASLINQITGTDCWGVGAGIIGTTVTFQGPPLAYTSPPAVTIAAPPSMVNTNLSFPPAVMAAGTTAVVRSVIETDTVNFAASVGQLKDIIVIDAGSGYYTNAPFTLAPPALTIPGAATATASAGSCGYNVPLGGEFRGFPSISGSGATGLGKMVNVINNITGSPKTVVDLINGVNDGQQLGIMINGVSRSSNLVGVLNATLDANRNNNATLNDMITLLNALTRADTYKLVHLLDALGDAREVSNNVTVPAGDHDMVAQLLAPYSHTGNLVNATSGVGSAQMATLISSLSMNGGGGYTNGGTVTGPGGLTAVVNVAAVNAVTGIEVTNPGAGCTSLPTINIVGGTGSGLQVAPYMNAGQLARVNILNGGSYTVAPTLAFSGGGCTTTPAATVRINGIGTVTLTNGGTGYNNNGIALTISAGPGAGAVLTPTVSGTIEAPGFPGLGSFAGGSRYSTGDVCPIVGAGGTGGTCTVTAAASGELLGCSAISGGSNYSVGRIVKIGGAATAVALVNAGTIATGLGAAAGGLKIVSTGCGYAAPPAVQVVGCTTPPTVSVVFDAPSGRVTDLNVTVAGTGCSSGVKVRVGEIPYEYHSDGATAIVQNVTAASGKVTSISVSQPAINAAQLVELLDRDAIGTGIAFNYRADDAAWAPPSACSSTGLVPTPGVPCASTDTLRPNISTREAMVRLLHHGITPTLTSSKSTFNGTTIVGAGNLSRDWPGLGSAFIAGAILNNVGSASTQTLINLMNSDTISLEDTIILLGCGDRSSYTNIAVTPYTWEQLCRGVGPGIW